jgi:hypothetical protein
MVTIPKAQYEAMKKALALFFVDKFAEQLRREHAGLTEPVLHEMIEAHRG